MITSTQTTRQITHAKGLTHAIYSGPLAIVEHAKDTTCPSPAELDDHYAPDHIREWTGKPSLDVIEAELTNPDPSLITGLDKYRESMTDLIKPPTMLRRKIRRNLDDGHEIDTDKYLARIPEMWERMEKIPAPRRTIKIGINQVINAEYSQKDLYPRGAAVLSLAQFLTARQYNVEIVIYTANANCTDTRKMTVLECVVKHASQHMDTRSLATLLCSIAFWRGFTLRAQIRAAETGVAHFGLGHVTSCPDSLKKSCDHFAEHDILSERTARAWLAGIVKTYDAKPTTAQGAKS